MKWIWIILALLYFLLPYDIVPGVHPVGWIDDIVVLILLYYYLKRLKGYRTGGSQPFGAYQDQYNTRSSGNEEEGKAEKPPRTPYEILDLPPNATQEAIKGAYRKLASQYHPDKVAHLGKEFQDLAERRFKEIQEAYEKLVR